jgi:hypothetical protein
MSLWADTLFLISLGTDPKELCQIISASWPRFACSEPTAGEQKGGAAA